MRSDERGWIYRESDGEGGNRTHDTTIFSRVLYQLSYLARDGKASDRAGIGLNA